MQLKPRFGFDMNGLKPIEHIKNVKGAVMIITGTKDNYTTLKESKQMFKEAKEPKVLWVIEGKGHVNFDEALGDEYEERVLTFLEEWMKN
jgi:esterase/lipase